MISVQLVDDHMVVRKGLRLVLGQEDDFSVVGEAERGEEALYLCQKLKPDVILMDAKMDGIGGVGYSHDCSASSIYSSCGAEYFCQLECY